MLRKIKESHKVRQNQGTLSHFPCFLRASTRYVFLQGRLNIRLCPSVVLRFTYSISMYATFLSHKLFGNSWGNSYIYYYCPFNVRVSPSTGVGLIRRHVDGLIAFLHSILVTTLPSLRLREDKSCLMLSSHLFFGRPRG